MKIGRIGLFALLGLTSVAATQPAAGTFTIGVLTMAAGPSPAFMEALRGLGYQEGGNLRTSVALGEW